ncbi:hypothetical protein M0805_009031 [Coniferiporia weirii]|nr:hypothetical protein M0805_009031 [Coniferiporia weirii]
MSDQNSSSGARGYRPSNPTPRIGRIGQWGDADSRPSSAQSGSSGGRRIATFRDIGASSGGGGGSGGGGSGGPASSDDDDDDESGGENWFTGGERSGLSVQNPNSRQNVPGGDLVKGLLKKAAQAGPPPSVPDSPASRGAFSGSGHTLGSDDVESQVIPDPNAPPERPATEQPRVVRHLTFWRNGFSVEDGPLLSYTENQDTLEAINRGQAPQDILGVQYGQPVELRVARRTDDDYTPPPPRPLQAFDGAGHRLGAPTPGFTSEGSVSLSAPGAPSGSQASSSRRTLEPESVQPRFEVDQSQPTTSIQLRLADGTRMVCRMNLSHTVRDIRNFINAARPENLSRSYTIATTFPNRVLEDDMQTIEAAGLKNSVVVQRWA